MPIVAWTASPEILDIPVGTLVTADITEKKGTYIIESYAIVKVGVAA